MKLENLGKQAKVAFSCQWMFNVSMVPQPFLQWGTFCKIINRQRRDFILLLNGCFIDIIEEDYVYQTISLMSNLHG